MRTVERLCIGWAWLGMAYLAVRIAQGAIGS